MTSMLPASGFTSSHASLSQSSSKRPSLKRSNSQMSLPSPPTSDIEMDCVVPSKRSRKSADRVQITPPNNSRSAPRYGPHIVSDHSLGSDSIPKTSAARMMIDEDEDPFAAPKNGKLYLGQGQTRLPKSQAATYVFRGKKIKVDKAPLAEDDALISDLKPKLLFPSARPPPPAVEMTPIRTPKRPGKPMLNFLPPTPDSANDRRKARQRKLSALQDQAAMVIDEDMEDADPFGGSLPFLGRVEKARERSDFARKVGGQRLFGL